MFGTMTLMFVIMLILFNFHDGVQSFPIINTPPTTATATWKNMQNIGRIQHGSSSTSSQRKQQFSSSSTVGGMELMMSNKNNEEKGIPFLALAIGTSLLLSTWPLLTFLRDVNNPTDGFDVDMFMTLKGMLDSNGVVSDNSSSNIGMLTDENYQSIVELPALSPAEQLVGAVFGPPR